MATKSVIYVFTRDDNHPGRIPDQAGRQKKSMTGAVSMVAEWAATAGRSYQLLHEREDLFIVSLNYPEDDELAAGQDLNDRCVQRGLLRETITEMQVDKRRAE